MLTRLIGALLMVAGFVLSYLGWRSSNRLREIHHQHEWEDEVYSGGDLGALGTVAGAMLVLIGVLLLLRLL
jgi:hypothetical protein